MYEKNRMVRHKQLMMAVLYYHSLYKSTFYNYMQA